MKLNINIIGAGNVGKTIGYLFNKNSLIELAGICNTSKKSSLQAIKFIKAGVPYINIEDLPAADLTIIATPDDYITVASKRLSENKSLKKRSIVFHFSGALNSDGLKSLKNKGCYVASVHPMRSFAQPELSIKQFEGTYCAIEGDIKAVLILSKLINLIGGITFKINKKKKILYHAAGVFASNYLIGFAHIAQNCLIKSGVNKKIAIKIVISLMKSTVGNLEETLSPMRSLTGPIKRGDCATVDNHLKKLTHTERDIYCSIGKELINLTTLCQDKKDQLFQILT